MTDPETVSKWARRFVLTGALFLLAWQAAALLGVSRRTEVVLGLLGFVFHTVFGKAYSLVPTYFDRDLATDRWLPAHLSCTGGGVLLLAVGAERSVRQATAVGGILWAAGVVVFLATVVVSIRDNLTGSETGTGEHNAHRRRLDRAANLAVPVALAYLAAGSYELSTVGTGLPSLYDGYVPRGFHLLAVGTAALLVFAIGFRLLPRFLATTPPEHLALVVLPTGAVGPAILAAGLPSGSLLKVGAAFQTVAVIGYAAVIGVLTVRTDRTRIGIYGVVVGALAGVVAIGFGLLMAFEGQTADLVRTHRRVTVLGFLGLTIVGVSYQFYPPGVVSFSWSLPGSDARTVGVTGDRIGLAAIGCLSAALAVEVAGSVFVNRTELLALSLGVTGALLHAGLLGGIFRDRYG